jgi:hypothetical protein
VRRGAPLRADPAKVRAWQQRSRKPIAAVGRKTTREADALDAFRAGVQGRSGGRCELGAPACDPDPHGGGAAHHVWPSDRDRGVHDPERGLWACWQGHAWVHDHPTEAERRGWLGRSDG